MNDDKQLEQNQDDKNSRMVPPDPSMAKPTSLDMNLGRQALTIVWADGLVSRYPASFLRHHCPCAACKTEKAKQGLFPILKNKNVEDIRIVGGHTVGHYGLQLEWSDEHNVGIYDFRLLRHLHPQLPEPPCE